MKEIELVQGDTSPVYKFQRKDAGGVIETKPKKMWITFKRNTSCKDCLFQKTLDNGINFSTEDFYYSFKIQPEDTEKLCYGQYGFDIKILNEAGEKKTLLNNGVLHIVNHYTHKENEV